MSKRIKVGKVVGVHGLKGELKIASFSDLSDLIDIFEDSPDSDFFLVRSGKKPFEKVLSLESFRKHKSTLLVKFKDIDSRDDSEALKGAELEVLRELLPKLESGEFYLFDLLGLEVREGSEVLGNLKDIVNAGASDVYVIDGGDKGEVILPASEETIIEINIDKGFIRVAIPEGLLEED